MHWLEVTWLGSGDMPREVLCQGNGGQQRGESEAAIHSFVPGLLVVAAHLQGHSRHWPEGQ